MPTAHRGEASAFDFGAGGADTLRDFGWAARWPLTPRLREKQMHQPLFRRSVNHALPAVVSDEH